MRIRVPMLAKGLAVAVTMSWASVASAVPVTGTFTLVADLLFPGGPSTGPTVQGEYGFETDDIVLDPVTLLPQETDGTFLIPLNFFDLAINGSVFNVPGGDAVIGPFAVVSSPSGASVHGLAGFLTDVDTGETLTLSTDVDNSPQATFTSSTGGFFTASFSGNQTVPEPSALALFGAGLLAFGGLRARRRASKKDL